MTTYPVSALRTLALACQDLHTANGQEPPPDADTLLQVVRRIGCVQIDTLHMVRRSQYLVPWSRLGAYQPEEFDQLIFGSERCLFEGLEHAASIIPLEEYRLQMPHQRRMREQSSNWYYRWLNERVDEDFVSKTLERIRREGALKVSDFESDGHAEGGSWWNWRPAKAALELLFSLGELMIASREKFQRVYDLTERVLPGWVNRHEPDEEERDKFWVTLGARALGVCTGRQAGDYTWMKVSRSKPHVEALLREGELLPIKVSLDHGNSTELLIHRENLPLLQQAADGMLKAKRTTFLSPFDNLWWATRRDEMLWGFHQSIEAYLPAHKRTFGYFCLPILHKDRLVGRLDPKLERKTGRLILRALYLEPGIKPGEELVKGFAQAMRSFMIFHDAKELVIERSQPVIFGRKVLQAI